MRGRLNVHHGENSGSQARAWNHLRRRAGFLMRDIGAGAVASIVLIANIVSFGTLMFPGDLAIGAPAAIWSMLIAAAISGFWIALRTTLAPLATGIDSPTGAVLVLTATAASTTFLGAGVAPEITVQSILLLFSVASLLTGALLYLLGAFRLASSLRFVPYFVVAGFLAATGWFLLQGAVRMTTRWTPQMSLAAMPDHLTYQLIVALAICTALLLLRAFVKLGSAIPLALIAITLILTFVLRALSLSDPQQGWYFPSVGHLVIWWPWSALDASHLQWKLLMPLIPEWIAIAAVALISLVTKVSALEVSRQTSADLNREFRTHGIATLASAPVGGMLVSMQTATSRLLEEAGGATRFSGVFAALIVGAVALSAFDLQGVIPIPVIAGLVLYLAYGFFVDAFWRQIQRRAWRDLGATFLIMIVCARYGYLTGVLVGIVGACLLFAWSYARIGPIQRHIDRTKYQSNVDRSLAEMDYLRDNGTAIQIYWLAGYIFFGSSESIFETIKSDVENQSTGRIRFIILDFRDVSGADTSALVSLTKLRHLCNAHAITLAYCSLKPSNAAMLDHGGFFGSVGGHRAFGDTQQALGWCEDAMLAKAGLALETHSGGFESWLHHQLGGSANVTALMAFFQRREIAPGTVLYRTGDASDTVDLVASGGLAIDVTGTDERMVRRRRITTHTVLGEMGFFRGLPRSATVSTEGPTVLFTLTQAHWTRMLAERPELANLLYKFIITILADRIEFSNREIAALSG
jgi:sulfate permease, SulP family